MKQSTTYHTYKTYRELLHLCKKISKNKHKKKFIINKNSSVINTEGDE